MRSRVDFPAPDRPTTPTKDPGGISRETSSTADFTPKRRLTRSKISIDRPKMIRHRAYALAAKLS